MNDDIELYVQVEAETDLAIKVTDGIEAAWLPKSRIEYDPEDPEQGDEIKVTLPEWMAEDSGLI